MAFWLRSKRGESVFTLLWNGEGECWRWSVIWLRCKPSTIKQAATARNGRRANRSLSSLAFPSKSDLHKLAVRLDCPDTAVVEITERADRQSMCGNGFCRRRLLGLGIRQPAFETGGDSPCHSVLIASLHPFRPQILISTLATPATNYDRGSRKSLQAFPI